jgi:hypothetical protein
MGTVTDSMPGRFLIAATYFAASGRLYCETGEGVSDAEFDPVAEAGGLHASASERHLLGCLHRSTQRAKAHPSMENPIQRPMATINIQRVMETAQASLARKGAGRPMSQERTDRYGMK